MIGNPFYLAVAHVACWVRDRLADDQLRDELAAAYHTIDVLRADNRQYDAENKKVLAALADADRLLGIDERAS